ncbi:MAG: bacteriohemerythrin [Bacteroidetes bacterium]|nr:bacteriohemerythrin [Bacteroidota bacterium]
MIQKWKKEFELGHPTIDVHHRYLVLLMNILYESIKSDSARSQSIDVVQELKEYAQYHFNAEEQLFEHTDYPYVEHHKNFHKEFCLTIQRISELIDEHNSSAPIELIEFLNSWFINHILTVDMGILPYLNHQ